MDFENFKEYLSVGSSAIAIISFLFIIVKYIANYKYGKKCEYKFKVPYNFFTFNIEEVLIETVEYILILVSIIFLVILTTYNNRHNDFLNYINPVFLFGSLFLYMVGTIGIIQEKISNPMKVKKHVFCCDAIRFCFVYVVIPLIITCITVKKIIPIIILIIFMVIIALICILILLVNYFDFDKKKYEIIKDENGSYYAVLTRSKSKFVIVDVVEDNNSFRIKEKGNYRVVDKILLFNVKYAIMLV